MTDDKTEGNECCGPKSRCCGGGGSKVLIGALIGLLLAGAGFGLYRAGKCVGKGKSFCPLSSPQSESLK